MNLSKLIHCLCKLNRITKKFFAATLDNFFRLSQGNSSFEDYVTNHELALADATEQCGLQMNSIGQSYFLLEGSNLTDKQRFDIRMRCDGKLADTAKIKNLAAFHS